MLSPLILILEFYSFSWIADLLREPSDIAVAAGSLLLCAFIAINILLINHTIKQLKKAK